MIETRDYYRLIVATNYWIDTGLLTKKEAIEYWKKHWAVIIYNYRTKEVIDLQ